MKENTKYVKQWPILNETETKVSI